MPTPEDKARENIDRLLTQAGWAVRDQSAANILAANLDIFWLRDESLEESDNLPDPTCSLRKLSKISKPPSNNSVKSPRIYVLTV
jgi:hypothetical protein